MSYNPSYTKLNPEGQENPYQGTTPLIFNQQAVTSGSQALSLGLTAFTAACSSQKSDSIA